MIIEQPIALKIDKIVDEAKDIKTFVFTNSFSAKPGQFVLVWLPRIDMKPFGVSFQNKNKFCVTVSKVGNFTTELFKKNVGDYVGVMGPYGKGFSMDKKNVVLIGGGYGTASLTLLADQLEKENRKVRLIIGSKNKNLVLYKERYENSNVEVIFTTDDGSYGKKGFTTDVLRRVLESDNRVDMIYTCGPEIMMKKVVEITDEFDVDCEVCIERYMKCGFGICGQCCVDGSGVRVCKEGPVFDKEFIKKHISEFGGTHRNGMEVRR